MKHTFKLLFTTTLLLSYVFSCSSFSSSEREIFESNTLQLVLSGAGYYRGDGEYAYGTRLGLVYGLFDVSNVGINLYYFPDNGDEEKRTFWMLEPFGTLNITDQDGAKPEINTYIKFTILFDEESEDSKRVKFLPALGMTPMYEGERARFFYTAEFALKADSGVMPILNMKLGSDIRISDRLNVTIAGEELDIGKNNKSIIGVGFNIIPQNLRLDFNE